MNLKHCRQYWSTPLAGVGGHRVVRQRVCRERARRRCAAACCSCFARRANHPWRLWNFGIGGRRRRQKGLCRTSQLLRQKPLELGRRHDGQRQHRRQAALVSHFAAALAAQSQRHGFRRSRSGALCQVVFDARTGCRSDGQRKPWTHRT